MPTTDPAPHHADEPTTDTAPALKPFERGTLFLSPRYGAAQTGGSARWSETEAVAEMFQASVYFEKLNVVEIIDTTIPTTETSPGDDQRPIDILAGSILTHIEEYNGVLFSLKHMSSSKRSFMFELGLEAYDYHDLDGSKPDRWPLFYCGYRGWIDHSKEMMNWLFDDTVDSPYLSRLLETEMRERHGVAIPPGGIAISFHEPFQAEVGELGQIIRARIEVRFSREACAAIEARLPEFTFNKEFAWTIRNALSATFCDVLTEINHGLYPGSLLTPFSNFAIDHSRYWMAKPAAARPAEEQIVQFQDAVFSNGRALAAALTAGTIPYEEATAIVERAERWRGWAGKIEGDTTLIREYLEEVSREPLIARATSKSFRWLAMTGLGLGLDFAGAGGLGTMAGIGLSAFDAFLLDKLATGWRPSQFIETAAKQITPPAS